MPDAEEALTRTAYDTVADAYAEHITGTSYEQGVDLAMIDHFVGLLAAPRRVLDAGCGAGRMLPYLAERGCSPEGIDLSPAMVARARRDHPQFRIEVGTLTDLPLPDGEFDGIFSWYSTIHNPDQDLERMFSEMVRVLRPGGLLLLGFQTGNGMRRVGKGYQGLGYDVVMNRYHRSPDEMVERLEHAQLELVARMERAAVGSEADGQAVLIARRSA